jgi:tetratricopeptide (TPR) repeat protein
MQVQLVDQIEREQNQNGELSYGLVDPLTRLSLLFQESGDHTLAIAALERALQLVRVNHGLRAFEQAPLLRLLIRNEQARGNIAAAWKHEQELLALAKRHPDELRTISILHEVGDRRIALLDRYLGGEAAQEVVLGCYYALASIGETSCTSGEKHVVVQGILTDAWKNYLGAIDVYLRHGLYTSDELRELEMELLQSSYVYGNYGLGKESLERLLDYDIANAEPLATQLEALLRLADWDLLFGRIITAHQQYLQAYQLLGGDGTAHTARLFSPEQPIALPAFLQSPLASNAEGSTGFIDVAFDITWHGNAKRVEILDASPNTPNEVKKELVNRIGQMRFRPSIGAGEIPPSSRVVLRYRLSPQRETVEDPKHEARQRNIRQYRADMGLPRQFIESLPPANGTTEGADPGG